MAVPGYPLQVCLVACFQILSLLAAKAVDLGLCQENVICLATIFPQNPPISNLGHLLTYTATDSKNPESSSEALRAMASTVQMLLSAFYFTVPGPSQAVRQISGLENMGWSQVACLDGYDLVSVVTQKRSCVLARPQISSREGSFGSTSKTSRQLKTSVMI